VITATDLEVRAGARILLSPDGPDLRIQPGDRIGLVGRNGAGKTTTLRILAGETEPYAGSVTRTGEVGYLPQDPKEGDLEVLARDRVLSARGLDVLLTDLEKQRALMAEVADDDARDRAIRRYGELEERFVALGGYSAESEAGRICASLGLAERVLTQQLHTLSGGQRRRVELARILFAASDSGSGSSTTLLLDEPTNHLDADSLGWLRDFLRSHTGGLVVISHNVDLIADVVNRVWFLDAVRGEVDVYNMGWQKYLDARATDEQRRRRERTNAERKAASLRTQAAKLGAKATKATAAQNMLRRADRMMAELDEERVADRVARIKFPVPAACGRTPLVVKGLSKSYGSLEVFTGVDLAIDRGSRVVVLGLNGAGKTTMLRLLAGVETPDTGGLEPGYGLRIGYFAQEHDTLDNDATVWENIRYLAPDSGEQDLRGLREDPAGIGRPGGVHGERAAARRTDQQPRSGIARTGS
jgi:ATPase subunit of ABC transporter with duplicated ATPase domains